jgi:hypothetical protein
MTVIQAISRNREEIAFQQNIQGTLHGRSVVQFDASYADRQKFVGGAGGGFDLMIGGSFIIGAVAITALCLIIGSTAAVALSTQKLAPSLITFGVTTAISLAALFYIFIESAPTKRHLEV